MSHLVPPRPSKTSRIRIKIQNSESSFSFSFPRIWSEPNFCSGQDFADKEAESPRRPGACQKHTVLVSEPSDNFQPSIFAHFCVVGAFAPGSPTICIVATPTSFTPVLDLWSQLAWPLGRRPRCWCPRIHRVCQAREGPLSSATHEGHMPGGRNAREDGQQPSLLLPPPPGLSPSRPQLPQLAFLAMAYSQPGQGKAEV